MGGDYMFLSYSIMILSYFTYVLIKTCREKLQKYIISNEYKDITNEILKLNVKKITNKVNVIDSVILDEKTDNEEILCCVCRDNKIKLMIIPCNHACLCFSCRKNIKSECPICKNQIDNYTKCFI